MNQFEGRVAVVTGAASGIGLGMARAFATVGMKVVLADIEEPALSEAAAQLREAGAEVAAVPVDVADRDSVLALAEAARGRFGNVHVLCNNAGVGGATGGAPGIWNAPPESWQWVMSVNLMGVVHGLQAFVPGMLRHGEPGHVVNTSSVVGVWSGDASIYSVSKHAVAALTEGLYQDLVVRRATALGVSLLLPGLTATRINTAARNRPETLRPGGRDFQPEVWQTMERMDAHFQSFGMEPGRVGEIVLEAIRDDRFYVFTHPESMRFVEQRMRAMLDGGPPGVGPGFSRERQP